MTGRVVYLPCAGYNGTYHTVATQRVVYYAVDARGSDAALPLLSVRNLVTDTQHQINIGVTLFPVAPIMLKPFTERLALFMPINGRVPHFTTPHLPFIGCCTLPCRVNFGLLSLITMQSSLRMNRLPLHLPRHDHNLQV